MEIVAKDELRRLTDIQNKEYHAPNTVHPRIESEFVYTTSVVTWYSPNEVVMEKREEDRAEGKVKVKYPITPTQSFAKECQIRVVLPHMYVKKKYLGKIVICLPHNPGLKVFDKTELLIKDLPGNGGDNYWQNVHPQFNRKGDTRNFNQSVGNIDFLETWTTELPRVTFNVDQPFGLLQGKMSLPVFLCYKEDNSMNFDISFKYSFNLSVKNLVRMGEVQEDGSIIPIEFRKKYIVAPENIDIPNMVLRYNYVTDQEVKFIKEQKLGGDKEENRVIRKFYKDVTCYTYNDGIKYDKEHPMILESKSPVLAIFWSAEDKKYKDNYNIHGNYTSNPNNVYAGYNMIKNSSLFYGPIAKFQNFEPDQVELAQSRDHMPKCPMDNGYNVYALCNDPFSDSIKPGVVMMNKDTTLNVKISNTDPRLCLDMFKDKDKNEKVHDSDEDSSDEDEEEIKREIEIKKKVITKKDKYILHVALLTQRKLEIRPVKDEKDVYSFLLN